MHLSESVKEEVFFFFFLSLHRPAQILTANLQLALHRVLPAVIDRLAHVNSAIEGTGFADLQRQDAMLAEHPVLGFIRDVHLVFVPGDFRLTGQDKKNVRRVKLLPGIEWRFMRLGLLRCATYVYTRY